MKNIISLQLKPMIDANISQDHKRRWGFNDLQRRQDDMCDFINDNCNGGITPKTIHVFKKVNFIPLPASSH